MCNKNNPPSQTWYLRVKKSTCMRCTQNKLYTKREFGNVNKIGDGDAFDTHIPAESVVTNFVIMMKHTVQTITVISNARTLFLRSKASYMPINLARHFTLLYSRHSFAWEELLAKFPLPSVSWQCCLCRSEDICRLHSQPSKVSGSSLELHHHQKDSCWHLCSDTNRADVQHMQRSMSCVWGRLWVVGVVRIPCIAW